MKYFLLFLLTAIFSASLQAAETYTIDSNHTLPRFSYNHLGYSTQLSRFDKVSGKITLDRKNKTGTVEVKIDTKSVNTGSTLFNEHIQGADYLDTARYPEAVFRADKVKFDGNEIVAVNGVLTLKGISKPVVLIVTSFHCMPHPMLKKEACGANATASVKRSDFNMGKYAPLVGDEVTLEIPVEAVKE